MKDQGTGQEIDPQRAALDYNRQLSQPSYVTEQQEWNRVHAQLLKSVADAQGKLLAGINETERDVEQGFLGTYEKLTAISGRLDAIGAILAELLTVRRPTAVKRAKRRR